MADDVKVSKFAKFRKDFTKFFKEVRNELKKVIWPSREQLVNNTVTVLMSCALVGLIIWVVDAGLTTLVEVLLTR